MRNHLRTTNEKRNDFKGGCIGTLDAIEEGRACNNGRDTMTYEKYLGDTDIEDFNDTDDIREYFSRDNLIYMFGPEEYNGTEADAALDAALDAYANIQRYVVVNASNMVMAPGGFVCMSCVDEGCQYTRNQLLSLDCGEEINPVTWYENSEDDMGWGDEHGNIFAQASKV